MYYLYKILDLDYNVKSLVISDKSEDSFSEYFEKELSSLRQFLELYDAYSKYGKDGYIIQLSTISPDYDAIVKISNRLIKTDSVYKIKSHLLIENTDIKRNTFRGVLLNSETIHFNAKDPTVQETAKILKEDVSLVREIIKTYMLFVINCIKNLDPVRIPIIGAFKIKKYIFKEYLKQKEDA